MPKIRYQKITFREPEKLAAISSANTLITDYLRQGYKLSLRQLYYQFVAKDLFPATKTWTLVNSKWVRDPGGTKNAEPNYQWLGAVIADARMAGYMDWEAIEDRTRDIDAVPHWETAADILGASHRSFRVDKWTTQSHRLEVWVEKDAVEGIAKQAAHAHDVPIFSCRGYGSLSSLWASANRLRAYVERRQKVVLLHLGDHDPSGIDMTRDLNDRLNHFIWSDLLKAAAATLDERREAAGKKFSEMCVREVCHTYGLDEDDVWNKRIIEVRRIALTMDQVRQYDPPPNPAKTADARFKSYQEEFGDECWELDALEPSVLDALISDSIEDLKNYEEYAKREATENHHLAGLKAAAEKWDDGLVDVVIDFKPKTKVIHKQEFVPPAAETEDDTAASIRATIARIDKKMPALNVRGKLTKKAAKKPAPKRKKK